jgi:outer membrane protein assembly factor BamB
MTHRSVLREGLGTIGILAAACIATLTSASENRSLVHADGLARGQEVAEFWRFQAAAPVRNAIASDGGTLYTPSADGMLHALDPETGIARWSIDIGAAPGSPATDGGSLAVVDRWNRLLLIDTDDGEVRWTRSTDPDLPLPWGKEGWDYLIAAPTITEDAIYFGSGDGGLYKVRRTDGAVIWRFATEGRIRATPTVADGMVYIGSGDGYMHAVDARTGEQRWSFETDGASLDSEEFGFDRRQIYSAAAIAGDLLYFGSRDARLYALDRMTGEERWRFEEESAWIIATPVVADGVVYSTRSSSANVRALDAETGEELWVTQMGSFVFASPLVIGDRLYIGDGAGSLISLDRADGTEIGRLETGSPIWSNPAYHAGRLHFGDDDGVVRASTDLTADRMTAPALAVFWDEELVPISFVGGDADVRRTQMEGLRQLGFEVLDTEGLADFVHARRADGRSSAIVFTMDGISRDAVTADDSLAGYLNTGGRAIWLGTIPGLIERDPDTDEFIGASVSTASELLGVDLSEANWDHYPAFPTDAGRRIGLTSNFMNTVNLGRASEGLTVLARDEFGRPAAWSLRAPERDGTFVYLGGVDAPGCALAEIARHGLDHGGRALGAEACSP